MAEFNSNPEPGSEDAPLWKRILKSKAEKKQAEQHLSTEAKEHIAAIDFVDLAYRRLDEFPQYDPRGKERGESLYKKKIQREAPAVVFQTNFSDTLDLYVGEPDGDYPPDEDKWMAGDHAEVAVQLRKFLGQHGVDTSPGELRVAHAYFDRDADGNPKIRVLMGGDEIGFQAGISKQYKELATRYNAEVFAANIEYGTIFKPEGKGNLRLTESKGDTSLSGENEDTALALFAKREKLTNSQFLRLRLLAKADTEAAREENRPTQSLDNLSAQIVREDIDEL